MESPAKPQKTGGFTPFVPYVTFALAGINVLVFAADALLGLIGYGDMLTVLGAKVDILIVMGQYWRLITPIVLHSGIDHLISNSIGLLIWGKQVEFIMGRTRFLIIYLVSGLCGSLLGFALSNNISVGASGAIFGLFGVFLYLMRSRPGMFNGPLTVQVLIIIGLNLFSGFVNPRVDNLGHIGGLIGGYVCAWVLGTRGDRAVTPIKAVFLVLLVLFMAVALWMGHAYPAGLF